MTRRLPRPAAPGTLEDYAARFWWPVRFFSAATTRPWSTARSHLLGHLVRWPPAPAP